jgi:amino acid transporter
MALIHASIMVYRLTAAEPGKSIFSFYFGPQLPLFSLGMQKIMYQSGALLLLLAIAVAASGGRDYYTQHRHALCLMNRLLRLVFSSAQLLSSGARDYLAPSLALRTHALQQRPWKAVMLMTLHPVIFWMTQVRALRCHAVQMAAMHVHCHWD